MATFGLIEYKDRSAGSARHLRRHHGHAQIDWIKHLLESHRARSRAGSTHLGKSEANHGPGALDPLTKELIYIAVSVTNNCNYCIASHTASAFGKGMTDAMFKELQAIIAWPTKPTNSSPVIKSKSTSASSPLFRDNLHNFFLTFRASPEPSLATPCPP